MNKRKHKSSPFRFVSSGVRGRYSVMRGDEHIGYVEKRTLRLTLRGVRHATMTWEPHAIVRGGALAALATEATREAAARSIWARYQYRGA